MTAQNRTLIAFIAFIVIALVAPFFLYPVYLMKILCFALFACAFNLLLGLWRIALLRPCHVLRRGFVFHGAYRQGLGLVAGTRDPQRGRPAPRCSASWPASSPFAGRGIYFAMVTLALAQMFFFFALQAPFTGGEDGITVDPAWASVRDHQSAQRHGAVFLRSGDFHLRLPVHLPGDPLALRAGAQGHPRE